MSGTTLDRRSGGLVGTWASIVAGILIMIVLWRVYRAGVAGAFEPPILYVMALLVVVGLFALWGYWFYAREARWHMRRLSPVALALGALGTAVGALKGPVYGGALIVIAYLVELAVGVRLYRDFRRETGLGAVLFLVGVAVFMLFLPLAIIWPWAALVSLAGDAVKVAGLLLIAWSLHTWPPRG